VDVVTVDSTGATENEGEAEAEKETKEGEECEEERCEEDAKVGEEVKDGDESKDGEDAKVADESKHGALQGLRTVLFDFADCTSNTSSSSLGDSITAAHATAALTADAA
jgi:hypothetical protein